MWTGPLATPARTGHVGQKRECERGTAWQTAGSPSPGRQPARREKARSKRGREGKGRKPKEGKAGKGKLDYAYPLVAKLSLRSIATARARVSSCTLLQCRPSTGSVWWHSRRARRKASMVTSARSHSLPFAVFPFSGVSIVVPSLASLWHPIWGIGIQAHWCLWPFWGHSGYQSWFWLHRFHDFGCMRACSFSILTLTMDSQAL